MARRFSRAGDQRCAVAALRPPIGVVSLQPALSIVASILAGPSTPLAEPLSASTPAVRVCSIRSNAGNRYAAGEISRQYNLGKTTTVADGTEIICRVRQASLALHRRMIRTPAAP